MSDATFQTFLVSGLLVLIAAIVYLAWSAWRWIDRQRDMEGLALQGIGYELSANLLRMLKEMGQLSNGELNSASDLLPISHPQLDAVLAGKIEMDRRPLTLIRSTYDELVHRKTDVKTKLAQGADALPAGEASVNAAVDGLALLYLWQEHGGRLAGEAHSTRSWDVRDWMKTTEFHADLIPGLHLRDAVVERLRAMGMTLTPKPLDHTAHEYFSKRYDRKADPNAPFWKRKQPKPVEEAAEAPAEAVEQTVPEPVVEPAPNAEPAPEPASTPEPTPESSQAEPVENNTNPPKVTVF